MTVDGEVVGSIESGRLVLVGAAPGDGERECAARVDKLAGRRVVTGRPPSQWIAG